MVAPSPDSSQPIVRRPASGVQLAEIVVNRPSSGAHGSFLVAEKSGWLDKKGKRRWFVLTGGEFAWYDQPRQHQRGEKPNGSIPAKDASVAQIGEIGNGTHTPHATRPTARSLLLACAHRLLCVRDLLDHGEGERVPAAGVVADRDGGLGGGVGPCRRQSWKGQSGLGR
jgi:hypothetical protein